MNQSSHDLKSCESANFAIHAQMLQEILAAIRINIRRCYELPLDYKTGNLEITRAGLEPATLGLKVRCCYQTELSSLNVDIQFHGYTGCMSCRGVSWCRFVSPLRFNFQRARMIAAGFEPATVRLEGVCSIQLS